MGANLGFPRGSGDPAGLQPRGGEAKGERDPSWQGAGFQQEKSKEGQQEAARGVRR